MTYEEAFKLQLACQKLSMRMGYSKLVEGKDKAADLAAPYRFDEVALSLPHIKAVRFLAMASRAQVWRQFDKYVKEAYFAAKQGTQAIKLNSEDV